MFDWIFTTDEEPGGYVGGEYYDDFGGTSGACPNVAGSSGLTYDMYIDNHFGNNIGGSIPYSCTIKALMIADAQQYPLETGGNQITRNVQGWGTPDMENMYNLGAGHHVIEEYPQALGGGGIWSRDVYVDGTYPLKVTLSWIDPAAPSGTGAGRALINNLDLKLISPSGTEYFGNLGLDTDLWSVSGTGSNRWSEPAYTGSRDDLNNVENVFIQNTLIETGQWTIQVAGRLGDVPNGPQHFSVVASGASEGEPPTVEVSTPNGGEDWKVGTFHDIEWTMSDSVDLPTDLLVTIDYSIDGGFTFPYNIITNQNGFGGSGSYNWDVPNTPTSDAVVRITVENTMGYVSNDESDSTFTISVYDPLVQVLSPNGGESLLGGGSWDIQWTASAGTNPLKVNPISIDYSLTGPGGPWNPIATDENNDGTFIWNTIPVIDANNCYVRITAEDTLGNTGDDTSDSNFAIDSTAPVPATGPNAELTGLDVTVYWTASPSPDVGSYEVWHATNDWDPTGSSYTWLGTVPAGTTNYVHVNRGINNQNSYSYQIRTVDIAGNSASTMVQAAKFSRTLSYSGNPSHWWLLGSCLVQSDTSLAHVIQGQGLSTGGWDSAMAWDAVNDKWISHVEGRPPFFNDLTDITNEMGFWLHITGNARFATAGYVDDMTISLDAGWNMVTYPYAERMRTTAQIETDLIVNCPGYIPGSLTIFDYSNQYGIAPPTGAEQLPNEEGFWIQVAVDTTWMVNNY
jgi:hypothetical protein